MLLHICWISNKQPLAYTQNDFKGDNMPILCLQLLHLPPSGQKIIIVALNNTKYLKVFVFPLHCDSSNAMVKLANKRLVHTDFYPQFHMSLFTCHYHLKRLQRPCFPL